MDEKLFQELYGVLFQDLTIKYGGAFREAGGRERFSSLWALPRVSLRYQGGSVYIEDGKTTLTIR